MDKDVMNKKNALQEEKLASLIAYGNYDEALKLVDEMDSHGSDIALFYKAALLAELGEFEQALACYEKVIEQQPDFHIAQFQYGLLNITLGEENGADVLRGLTKHADGYIATFSNALLRIVEGDIDEANKLLQRGLEENKQNPSLNKDMKNLSDRITQVKTEQYNENDVGDGEDNSQQHLLDIYKRGLVQ